MSNTKEVKSYKEVIKYEAEQLFRNITEYTDAGCRVSPDERIEHFTKMGAEIQELREEFRKSEQGKEGREIARSISLRELNAKSLEEIGREIFADEICEYSLTVFFSFCKELFKRSYRALGDFAKQIYIWTTDILFDTICPWVQKNGGWGIVMGNVAGTFGLTDLAGDFLLFLS